MGRGIGMAHDHGVGDDCSQLAEDCLRGCARIRKKFGINQGKRAGGLCRHRLIGQGRAEQSGNPRHQLAVQLLARRRGGQKVGFKQFSASTSPFRQYLQEAHTESSRQEKILRSPRVVRASYNELVRAMLPRMAALGLMVLRCVARSTATIPNLGSNPDIHSKLSSSDQAT